MTIHPALLRLSTEASTPHALTVTVGGELDHDTGDAFLTALTDTLDAHAAAHGATLRDLHVDCAGLTAVDSLGLSTLLMLHRRTHPAGVTLHLDAPPTHLVRLLEVTGTADYLSRPALRVAPATEPRTGGQGTAPAT